MTARQRIIDILVADKQSQLTSDSDFARHVLTRGFPGFSNMSASQLQCTVCDARLDLREGMGLLLHELAQEELLPTPKSSIADNAMDLPVFSADPRLNLATEIRRYFQHEASPAMVNVMLETLGPLAESMSAEDNFKALNGLSAAQLRRLVPMSLALRDRVRALLVAVREDA